MGGARSKNVDGCRRLTMALGLAAAVLPLLLATPGSAATLDRVREAGRLVLGYEPEARPFSYRDEAGKAAGYAVALCQKVADAVGAELALPSLAVEWVPVTLEERFQTVRDGKVDLLCGADTVTLTRRKEVSFSIPIFPSGIGAVLSSSAPRALREVLIQGEPRGGLPSGRPIWRASPARTVLDRKTFSVVGGTTGESWLGERLKRFQLAATVVPVAGYEAGIQQVIAGEADVFFGDLPILIDASRRSAAAGDVVILPRHFTYEPQALVLARGDEDFRLLVDRALSDAYRSEAFREFFSEWFGEPDDDMATFFRQTALPE